MSLDGVIQLDDGNWYYFNRGNWQYVNGLYPNSAGWWYVEDGQVDFSHEGLETYGGSEWYVKNGLIQFDYNGPVAMTITDDSSEETRQTLYYISNGRVDTGFTGLAQATLNGEDGWFYFQNGMWDQYPDTSLAEYGDPGGTLQMAERLISITMVLLISMMLNGMSKAEELILVLPEEQKAIRWLLMGWKFRSRLIL